MESLAMRLRGKAAELGARVFGIADTSVARTVDPALFETIEETYRRAVVMGIRLHEAVLRQIVDRPTPLYFHHYRQTNYRLDEAAWAVADILQDAGFSALAIAASQVVRKSPMKGQISHKALGWAAGLGFRGRNNLLVHPLYGAQVRYVSVLTDAPLPAGSPIEASCGKCRACVSVCPAGAIRERIEDFDGEACLAKLNQFACIPFIGQHVCGVCVKACGRRAEESDGRSVSGGTG